MPQRLFIAVDLPDEVRRRLGRLLPQPPDGVKPVRSEQIHLTLHFLGDVDEEAAAELAAALSEIRQPAFTIDLAGGGCFPSPRRPTVLWVGVNPSGPLQALYDAIAGVLDTCGLPVESRPFKPHVTLARVSRRLPAGWLEEFLRAADRFSADAVPVEIFTLYASERTNDGAMHTPLGRYRLM
jgi:2'-5' RNA ligase